MCFLYKPKLQLILSLCHILLYQYLETNSITYNDYSEQLTCCSLSGKCVKVCSLTVQAYWANYDRVISTDHKSVHAVYCGGHFGLLPQSVTCSGGAGKPAQGMNCGWRRVGTRHPRGKTGDMERGWQWHTLDACSKNLPTPFPSLDICHQNRGKCLRKPIGMQTVQ